MKEERFPHTRKPLRGQRRRVAEGGRFRAMEENTATGVRRAKRRDSHTEKFTSPRGLSAGGWELGLRLRRSNPRKRTGVGCVNTA